MKTVSGALATHLDGEVTTLAYCWRIERTDGVIFRFTNLDIDIVFGGETYKSTSGFSNSEVVTNASFSVNNLNAQAIFDDDDITEGDLRKGLFDYAEVRLFLVNFEDLTQGEIKVLKGRMGEVSISDGQYFTAELRDLMQLMSQNIGELYAPECRADLGDSRCKIPISVPEIERSTAYAVGDRVKVRTTSFVPLVPTANLTTNGSFETGDLTGWTGDTGFFPVLTSYSGINPFHGTYLMKGPSSLNKSISQVVDLVAAGVSTTDIDAGTVLADLFGYRANGNGTGDKGGIRFIYLDGALATISTPYDSGAVGLSPNDTWFKQGVDQVAVPALTRYIQVDCYSGSASGFTNDCTWDNLVVTLFTPVVGFTPTSVDFENRAYLCTIAGTTAASQPTYDTTVGQTTVDGTATFIAEQAFNISFVVENVTSNKEFTSVSFVPSVNYPDDWFNLGAVTWELGANTGLSTEVRDFIADTGVGFPATVTLFLPTPFNIVAGDIGVVFAGCDKRRSTCRDKFANTINFRGEPDLPGADLLMRFPDAKQ